MTGRNTTAAFTTEMGQDTIRPRILIEADFTSGTVYVWNGNGDLSWNGQTWSGVGNFLSLGDVVESTDIKIERLTITFSMLPASYKLLALDNVELSNDVTIYLALIDSAGAVVSDPEMLFTGKMDEVEVNEGADAAIFRLGVNNRLVELTKSKERRYTHQDHLQIHSDDTAFRHMVNAEATITWGSTK